eukprot:scaffold1457_cov185-Amphora_coffeaeformis.AAC.6
MKSLFTTTFLFLFLLATPLLIAEVHANPISHPYIALRTDPYEEEKRLEFPEDKTISRVTRWDRLPPKQCPLQFSLGISKRWHRQEKTAAFAIHQAPIVQTVFPAAGPGKSVLYTTRYEHLDLLSPAPASDTSSGEASVMREALLQNPEYPWLWESSAFHASPVVHDVNADGIPDVILADYDGGIFIRSMANAKDDKDGTKRYSHHAQVPRLYVRRHWVEGRVREAIQAPSADNNTTDSHNDMNDPYHSYFEYFYGDEHKEDGLLRGVTANHLGHDSEQAEGLQERRKRRVSQKREKVVEGEGLGGVGEEERLRVEEDFHQAEEIYRQEGEEEIHRRLEEILPPDQREMMDDIAARTADDLMGGPDDVTYPMVDDYDRSEIEEEREMMIDDDLRYGGEMVSVCVCYGENVLDVAYCRQIHL